MSPSPAAARRAAFREGHRTVCRAQSVAPWVIVFAFAGALIFLTSVVSPGGICQAFPFNWLVKKCNGLVTPRMPSLWPLVNLTAPASRAGSLIHRLVGERRGRCIHTDEGLSQVPWGSLDS